MRKECVRNKNGNLICCNLAGVCLLFIGQMRCGSQHTWRRYTRGDSVPSAGLAKPFTASYEIISLGSLAGIRRYAKVLISLHSLRCLPPGTLIHRQNSYTPRSKRCTGRREPANIIKILPVQYLLDGWLLSIWLSAHRTATTYAAPQKTDKGETEAR
jgi:hypothetical protein